jgi:glyceraldehyde-3-phosphate dehydrogenase (NADP+)
MKGLLKNSTKFAAKVDALVLKSMDEAVMLTPLPEKEKPAYIQEIDDAIQKVLQ